MEEPSKVAHIGNTLVPKSELKLVQFLEEYRDNFAWKPTDMPGVPRELIKHDLHLDPHAKPIKQQLRRFTQDKKDVIKKGIAMLLGASFNKEVYHSDWLANPILVPKKNKEWRMCVDYTKPNKTCKKDPFGLPRIDQVMDSMTGCSLLSFLDCYSGITRSPSRKKIRSRHLSLLCLVHFLYDYAIQT
jgi:hypothetical protein